MAKTMRRKYICTNGVVEVTQYLVGDKSQATGKRWRRAKSQEDKRDENARQAVRVAARILNCNYTPEDYLVTLTYSDENWGALFGECGSDQSAGIAAVAALPRDDRVDGAGTIEAVMEKARAVVRDQLDKVRKKAKRDGVLMKTLTVTSDLDPETGEVVRVHHHVVISGEAMKLLEESWKYGLVHTEHLYRQDDYTPLAAYLLGQVRHAENRKKYSCSRNMVQPKVEEMVLESCPDNEIRVQAGAKVLDRTPYKEGCVSQYVRYKRKPSSRKRGGHKQSGGNVPQNSDPGKPGVDAICGGSEFCEKTAEGGSGYAFSKIAWG